MHPMNVPAKLEVRSFTRYWVNRDSQKIGAVPGYAHTLHPPPPKKKICAYHANYLSMCTRFPAILDCSFEWELRTSNLGKGEAVGVEDGTVWKSIGEFL